MGQNWGPAVRRSLSLVLVLFLQWNTARDLYHWLGRSAGLYAPVSLRHMGYYDHRRKCWTEGPERAALPFLYVYTQEPCPVHSGGIPGSWICRAASRSYYDVTGSGGNVYLVKRLAYFGGVSEICRYGVFLRGSGYLAGQDRALQMIEDMDCGGKPSDIHYEWEI